MATNATSPGNTARDVLSLIGRVLVALLFVPGGWAKLTGFTGTAGYIASHGVPLPELAAAIAVVLELGCGLAFLVGWKTRWAALGLAVFTLVVTPIFHNYWAAPQAEVMMHTINFYKNLAIVGGLLSFIGAGGGAYSVDARTTSYRQHAPA